MLNPHCLLCLVLEADQCCFFCQRLASLSCFISTPLQQLVWAYCVHNFRIWRSQCSVIIGWKSKNDFCYRLYINWHKEYYFFVLTGRVHSQLLASMSNWSRIIFYIFRPLSFPWGKWDGHMLARVASDLWVVCKKYASSMRSVRE